MTSNKTFVSVNCFIVDADNKKALNVYESQITIPCNDDSVFEKSEQTEQKLTV